MQTGIIPNILILRGSIFLLVIRLMATVFVFALLKLIIRLPILYFDFEKDILLLLYSFDTLLIVLLAVLEVCIVVLVTLNWVNEYYEITPGEIIHNKGLFFTKKTIYTCEHVQSTVLEQVLIGKIFKFGTICLYSPALDEKIFLHNISHPEKNMHLIQDILNQSSKVKKGSTLYLKNT